MIVKFLRSCLVGKHFYATDETGDINDEAARSLLQSGAVIEATAQPPRQAAPRVREVATKTRKVETRG